MFFLHIPEFLTNIGPQKYQTIIGVIIPLWAILMISLERIWPYTPGIKLFRRGFWMDLVWYTLIQSKIFEILIFSYIILPLKEWVGLGNTGILSHWNFWLLLFLFFVTHDFYIYWFHRLQHSNKWLWRTHEAHHSCREVDWLAGSRSHFLEILINQTIEFLPIFFLLDSATAAYVFPAKALIDALWGMWIHANVNVNTGRLQYLINGPEMHQWHHANHHEVFYRNFSTKLAIWDWIFGTAYLPGLQPVTTFFAKPKMFGLPYKYPRDYFSQTIYALYRFSIVWLEKLTVYKFFINLRQSITILIFSLFGISSRWTIETLFDTPNPKYQLDEETINCPKCSKAKKYFYRDNQLCMVCENCESDVEFLEKF